MINIIIEYILIDVTGIIVQLFFMFTIVLMVMDKQKPPLMTAVLTGVALIIFGVGGSLVSGLVGILSAINGLLWLYIGWNVIDKNLFRLARYKVFW